MAGTLRAVSEGCVVVLPRSLVKPGKLGLWIEDGENSVQPGGMKRRSPTEYCNRKTKVIMGRDFLLVSRTCLRGPNKKFQFFHMSSLSAVEVNVKVAYREVCVSAQDSVSFFG